MSTLTLEQSNQRFEQFLLPELTQWKTSTINTESNTLTKTKFNAYKYGCRYDISWIILRCSIDDKFEIRFKHREDYVQRCLNTTWDNAVELIKNVDKLYVACDICKEITPCKLLESDERKVLTCNDKTICQSCCDGIMNNKPTQQCCCCAEDLYELSFCYSKMYFSADCKNHTTKCCNNCFRKVDVCPICRAEKDIYSFWHDKNSHDDNLDSDLDKNRDEDEDSD